MYYSAIGSIAILVLLIENTDVLTGRISRANTPAGRTYRLFLFSVLFYYVTDVLWGVIESRKIAGLLFADTTVYFITMAAGVLLWTKFVVLYLRDDSLTGKILVYGGRVVSAGAILLTLINIFVPVLFVVTPDCVYRALAMRYVVLGVQIVLLLLISVNAFTTVFRRETGPETKNKYRTIGAFGIIMALFLTMQLWFPYLPLYAIAYMLGTCLIRVFIIGDLIAESRQELREAERILELQQSITALMDNLPGMSFSKDGETGVYLACNQGFAEYAGKESPDEVIGLTDLEIFDPKTAAHFVEDDKKALAMDKPYVFVEDVPDAAGKPMRIQTTKLRFTDTQGRICVLGMCQDMTEQMILRQEAERNEEERIAYARINALIGDFFCMYIVDPVTGQYREYSKSKAFARYALPESGDDFFGTAAEYAHRYVYPDDQHRFVTTFTRENVMREIGVNGHFSMNCRFVMDSRPIHTRVRAAFVIEEEGMRLVVGVNNIEASVRQEEEYAKNLALAQKRASIDALTGVRNRHAFLSAEEDLDYQIGTRRAPCFAVTVLDVNDLKKVNDTEGHAAGDQVIRDACRVICDIFSHSPVFRIGGDEFAVISQGADYECIDELIERIEMHNEEAARDGGVIVACGMSKYDDDDSSVSVFERADHEMYKNKARLKGEN